jgi:hypothetical protein
MLSQLHRRLSYWVLGALFASGVLDWVLHGWCHREGPFGPQPHPLEPWMLRLHGAAAMLGLVALGSVLPSHVFRFWTLARNRAAGGSFLALLLVLVASGYGLYYLGGERWRELCRDTHLYIGLVSAPAFGLHLWRGFAARHSRVPPEFRSSRRHPEETA